MSVEFYLELLNFSMLKPIVGTISCACVCMHPEHKHTPTHKDKQVMAKVCQEGNGIRKV